VSGPGGPAAAGDAEAAGSGEQPARGLLDTSVFIANETGRALNPAGLPDESAISAVTIAELQVGVHAAADTDVRDYDMVEGVAGLSVLRV
jgi:hypothetical protein